jgi:hypothetical protein
MPAEGVMTWKCQSCGFDNPDSSSVCQGGCGFVRLGSLVLVAEGTGSKLTMNIDTLVGRRHLRKLDAAASRFASDPQFRLFRDNARGGWLVEHQATAVNPTLVNGVEISSGPVALGEGAILSIGAEQLKMRVQILF